jgi:hypothetical protein
VILSCLESATPHPLYGRGKVIFQEVHMYQLPEVGTPERAQRFWSFFEAIVEESFVDADAMIAGIEEQFAADPNAEGVPEGTEGELQETTDPEEDEAKTYFINMLVWFLAANGLLAEGTLDDGVFGDKVKESIRIADRLRARVPPAEEATEATAE